MRIFLAVFVALLGVVAQAQTISPVTISGNKSHLKGEFVTTNNSIGPEIVTIEPFKIVPDGKGGVSTVEIPSTMSVRVSQLSAKLGPKQNHTFQYEVKCPTEDCAVAFFAAFTGASLKVEATGVSLRFVLPTSAFVCQGKESADKCRAKMRAAWGVK